MGFFGKLFGGKGSSSTAKQVTQPPVRNNTSSDSAPDTSTTQDNSTAQNAFYGQHFEGLGDVWNAFFPGGSQEFVGKVQELFPQCTPFGPVMQLQDGMNVILFKAPEQNGIGIHCHILMKQGTGEAEFAGGYPALAGRPSQCRIEQAHIWSNNLAGVVSARALSNGAPLNFYLSGFFQHVPQMKFGAQAEFRLSALALSMQKQEKTEFSPEQGTPAYDALLRSFLTDNPDKTVADFVPPVVSSHGHGVLIPSQVVSAWIYQLPVLAVEKVEFMGHGFRRIETILVGVGESAVPSVLYVAEHVLKGYEPQVGDDVTGTLWLQGEMDVDPSIYMGQGEAPSAQ